MTLPILNPNLLRTTSDTAMVEELSIADRAAFVVVDIETLGLDFKYDPVVELGVRVVDKYLRELARNTWLVLPGGNQEAFQSMWKESSDTVREMHTTNGLYAELCALSEWYTITTGPSEGQQGNHSANFQSLLAWKWLTEELKLEAGKYPMSGSTPHFDRKFIDEQLAIFGGFFHYRNGIDVSSIKEICKVFNRDVYSAMAAMPEFQSTNKVHRPQQDIDATLREMQFYIDNFLFVEMDDECEGQSEIDLSAI